MTNDSDLAQTMKFTEGNNCISRTLSKLAQNYRSPVFPSEYSDNSPVSDVSGTLTSKAKLSVEIQALGIPPTALSEQSVFSYLTPTPL